MLKGGRILEHYNADLTEDLLNHAELDNFTLLEYSGGKSHFYKSRTAYTTTLHRIVQVRESITFTTRRTTN